VPEGRDYREFLNPASLEVLPSARMEPVVPGLPPGTQFQFERMGYFCIDTKHSRPGAPVINRTVTLKDAWAKAQAKS
jgi:glutaminyl-tRNA synthetase